MPSTFKSSFVYIAPHSCEARYKVGKANFVLGRLLAISSGDGPTFDWRKIVALQMRDSDHAYRVERLLHRYLAAVDAGLPKFPLECGGTEWFNLNSLPDLLDFLRYKHDKLGFTFYEGESAAKLLAREIKESRSTLKPPVSRGERQRIRRQKRIEALRRVPEHINSYIQSYILGLEQLNSVFQGAVWRRKQDVIVKIRDLYEDAERHQSGPYDRATLLFSYPHTKDHRNLLENFLCTLFVNTFDCSYGGGLIRSISWGTYLIRNQQFAAADANFSMFDSVRDIINRPLVDDNGASVEGHAIRTQILESLSLFQKHMLDYCKPASDELVRDYYMTSIKSPFSAGFRFVVEDAKCLVQVDPGFKEHLIQELIQAST